MKYKISLPCRALSYSDSYSLYAFTPELFSFLRTADVELHEPGSRKNIHITVSLVTDNIKMVPFEVDIPEKFKSEFAKFKLMYE